MSAGWVAYACLALGMASALVGGVFQSFSDFVMRGLVLAEPSAGVEVMQNINRTVFRSAFLAMFIGLAPLTLSFAAYAAWALDGSGRTWVIVAAAIYIASVFLVTIAGNVPMNEHLESLSHDSPEAATYWLHYGRRWTTWNHVRTMGSVATAVCFFLAALAFARSAPY